MGLAARSGLLAAPGELPVAPGVLPPAPGADEDRGHEPGAGAAREPGPDHSGCW